MAAVGSGALISALALATLGDRRHKGRLLFFSRGLMAVALTGLGFSRVPGLSMLSLAIAGYCVIIQLAVTNTLIQLMVPNDLRGRVISTYTWALGGFWPMGSLLIGAFGDYLGTSNTILLVAASVAVLTLLGRLLFPEIKDLS